MATDAAARSPVVAQRVDIEHPSTVSPARVVEKLVGYTMSFDAQHGTKILDALKQTINQLR